MSVQGGTTPLNSLLRKGKEEMIATKDLERIIQLALYSAYVKDERPVSILISSRVESGKTEILRKSSHLDGILYIADATAYGIQKEYLDQIATGKIRTIVIPDLITPLSRSSDTVETFIAFLKLSAFRGSGPAPTADPISMVFPKITFPNSRLAISYALNT